MIKPTAPRITAFRGPGLEKGIDILTEIEKPIRCRFLPDVHSAEEIRQIGKAVDILQLPAFLTRQTDFVVAAGESGCAINVKKAQFAAPWDVACG